MVRADTYGGKQQLPASLGIGWSGDGYPDDGYPDAGYPGSDVVSLAEAAARTALAGSEFELAEWCAAAGVPTDGDRVDLAAFLGERVELSLGISLA